MNGKAFEYALAIFSLALERRVEQEIFDTLEGFQTSLSEELRKFFRHPAMEKTAKKQVIEGCIEEPLVKNFLYLLVDNQRFEQIDDIVKEYRLLLQKQNRQLALKVFSKAPLSKETLQALQSKYTRDTGRIVLIENILDSSIIAGIRLEFDGYVLDQSINHYLEDLTKQLQR